MVPPLLPINIRNTYLVVQSVCNRSCMPLCYHGHSAKFLKKYSMLILCPCSTPLTRLSSKFPSPHPTLHAIIIQLRRRLETNTETDELRKRIEVLQVRVEREKQRSTELETALKAAHGSATSMPSPPSSRKGRSTVNNKVRAMFYNLSSVLLCYCAICHGRAAHIPLYEPSCGQCLPNATYVCTVVPSTLLH